MAKDNIHGSVSRRKLIIQVSLAVIWIVLGILLFVLNRGHTLLVDNKNTESPELRAPDLIVVSVDKYKPLEFFRGDRDLFELGGGKHRIRIEFSDGKPPFEQIFSLPLGPDMFILSVPKMINGIEPYIDIFYTQQESRSDDTDEEIVIE
jgi:hypothetical protein